MQLLLLHYLLILHFNLFNIIRIYQWPIQEALVVFLLQLLLIRIWVGNGLIAQGVVLTLNRISWGHGLIASCLRDVRGLAMDCLLNLIGMGLLIEELSAHVLVVFEVCSVAVSHLVLVWICLLIQLLWVTCLMLRIHVLRTIWMLTCLRVVLVCSLIALQMTVIKVLVRVCAAKITRSMLWLLLELLLPLMRQSIATVILKPIHPNNTSTWR